MTEGSGTELKCPGCGYSTIVWNHDGHASICPECGTEAILPAPEADELTANRMRESRTFPALLEADGPTDPVIAAPEGATDFDGVTAIDGVPVIETPGLMDIYDESVADQLTATAGPVFDQLETIEMKMPSGAEDIEPIYERGHEEPVDARVTGRTYEGSLSVDFDPGDDETFREWLEDAIEDAEQHGRDGPLR